MIGCKNKQAAFLMPERARGELAKVVVVMNRKANFMNEMEQKVLKTLSHQ